MTAVAGQRLLPPGAAGTGAGAGAWAVIVMVAALLMPLGPAGWWFDHSRALLPALAALAAAVWCFARRPAGLAAGLGVSAGVLLGSLAPLVVVDYARPVGFAAPGLWLFVLALGLLAWRGMALIAEVDSPVPLVARLVALLVPTLFGLGILYLWQVVVLGFAVPRVLLPAPSMIWQSLEASTPMLAADFHQTFVRAVIPGWLMGCTAGFLAAVLADRVPFLERGLLPIGNLVSALPIVGIAPIMVMWFGFDWQSKAAVVVVMTFFPMLVNTVAGLASAGRIERDLMRSYAATDLQTLLKLRLPNALPFVFNALKINSTLALIGAIVAEFFGTPIVGMGFRISTEVGKLNLDLVWATIAVAAVAGSAFYGALALLERHLTFWHPSYRG
ncbi:MAG TPA: ABC transporter permease [Geminicoccaceae bacterium]|nr:ABC transporter permease [Geminicoccaceae bacterium]